MTTLTADAAQSTYSPREAADGVTVAIGTYQYAVAPSTGEIINMIKLPPNVLLLALQLGGASPGSAAGPSWKVGYVGAGGTSSVFSAATSVSANQALAGGTAPITLNLPRLLTISDDTTVQYTTLTLKTGTVGSATTTTLVQLVAWYTRAGCGYNAQKASGQ